MTTDLSGKPQPVQSVPKSLAGARERNAEQRLRTVLEIAQVDVTQATPRELFQIDRAATTVSGVRFDFFVPDDARNASKVRKLRAALRRLQTDTNLMLATRIAARDRSREGFQRAAAEPLFGSVGYFQSREGSSFYTSQSVQFVSFGDRAPHLHTPLRLRVEIGMDYCRIGGSARDMFLLEVQRLLEDSVSELLRSCKGCGRVFVRRKRQEYCSKQCHNRTYWPKYVATERGRHRRQAAREREYATWGGKPAARRKRKRGL